MLSREELVREKEALGLTIEQIAERSGVPAGTLGKIFSGATRQPRRTTMEAIAQALYRERSLQEGKAAVYGRKRESFEGGHGLREQEAAFKPRKELFTAADYFALPEDAPRTELIEGVFYDMASPSMLHQELCLELALILKDFVRSNQGECRVGISPLDVQLENEDIRESRTVVQPDVMVICDRSKIRRHIVGAPDLVIEIVSPSSGTRDRYKKLSVYQEAGVREYWIVDPYQKMVLVYTFEKEPEISLYSFEDRVPVGIWDGELIIDFAQIRDAVGDLTEAD